MKSSIGRSYFLIPHGYDLNNLSETAITGRELADKIAAIRSQRLLLLLDCCHAGGVADDSTKAPGLVLAKAPLPPEAKALFTKGGGRIVICSSRADEISLGAQPYSLFTRALIDCFAGQGVAKLDGYVHALDLALYAREKVPTWSKERQHPTADIERADNFIVATYAAGAKEPRPLSLSPIDTEEVEQLNQTEARTSMPIGDIDLRGAVAPVIAPQGPVSQTFGSLTISFNKD